MVSTEIKPKALEGTGKSKHVFICYSHHDADFARENLIDPLKKLGFITCNNEDDFMPGVSVVQNIITAIRESLKYILVISEYFLHSTWCNYESELTLSHSIDMERSNVVIPLIIDGSEIPLFLRPFHFVEVESKNNKWFEKIRLALLVPIRFRNTDFSEIPELDEGKRYHIISLAHSKLKSTKFEKLQELSEKLEVRDMRIHVNANAPEKLCIKVDNSPSEHRSEEVVSLLADEMKTTSKVLLWISKEIEECTMCWGVIKMICMMARHVGHAPLIIPILLESDTNVLDDPHLCEHTYLFTKNYSWFDRLKETIYRQGTHSVKQNQGMISFREDQIFCVAEFNAKPSNKDSSESKVPLILDVSFAGDKHVILSDANSQRISKFTIFGNPVKHIDLKNRPGFMSRIDGEMIAFIIQNDSRIYLLDVICMELVGEPIQVDLQENEVIKGITAFSKSEMIITTSAGNKPPTIVAITVPENSVHARVENKLECEEKVTIAMPRRVTKTPDGNKVIVADKFYRRILVLDRQCNVLKELDKWSNRLYNIRGLSANNTTVFMAACNGIVTASLESNKRLVVDKESLIKFPTSTYHTRAVSLHIQGNFLAVSQATEETEIVRIFYIGNMHKTPE